jgi:hypothetical protein
MDLAEAQFKFEERIYLWSKELLKQEISENFPLLRSVKGTLAQHYLRILKQLEDHQAYSMAYALLRRGKRKEILDKWDDSFTNEDQKYVDLYLRLLQVEDHKDTMQNWPFSYYMQKKKFNRKIFRKRIRESLEPVLGNDFENWGGGNWRYCTNIGMWKVITWIDTGGKFDCLFYSHSIEASNTIDICESTSLFRWFGIAGGGTEWDYLEDEDAESVAFSLAKIIDLFVKTAPKLLRGLKLNNTVFNTDKNVL